MLNLKNNFGENYFKYIKMINLTKLLNKITTKHQNAQLKQMEMITTNMTSFGKYKKNHALPHLIFLHIILFRGFVC